MQLKLFSFLRLPMRASHGSWICCFLHVRVSICHVSTITINCYVSPFNKE
jgi:hypothetical protein